MDPILQVEVALNYLNTLLAKSLAFKDKSSSDLLHNIRENIYRSQTFLYEEIMSKLKKVDDSLKQYD